MLSVHISELDVGPAVTARVDALGERPQGDVAGYTAHPLTRHVAPADVHRERRRVWIEPALDDPVGYRRPRLLAALPFLFAALGVGDLLPYPVEGELQPRFKGA